MSQFKANENYGRHLLNMDYTAIQNAKTLAMDNDNWDEYDRLQEQEDQLIK
jgi:hypothetical protein